MRFATTLLAAAAGLLWAATAQAEDPDGTSACWKTAKTQLELDQCADADARGADQRLNKAYQAVLGQLDEGERKLLVEAQRAWIAFRDKDCGFWGSGGGSIAPMEAANCVASLSNDRAKELEDWVSINAPG